MIRREVILLYRPFTCGQREEMLAVGGFCGKRGKTLVRRPAFRPRYSLATLGHPLFVAYD
jgi:hypothetical protein